MGAAELAAAVVVAATDELVAVEVATDAELVVVATEAELVVVVGAAEDTDAEDEAARVVAGATDAVPDVDAGALAEPPQAASATLPRAASPKARSASRREQDHERDG